MINGIFLCVCLAPGKGMLLFPSDEGKKKKIGYAMKVIFELWMS